MNRQIIFAVDFDGTLCENLWPEIGMPNIGLIDYLKKKRSEGAYLILWTCRVENYLEDAVRWCAEQGLYFDAVNENSPYAKAKFGGDSRKIYADYYIDDKNLYVIGSNFSSSTSTSWRPTFRDLAKIDHPDLIDDDFSGGVFCCPHTSPWFYEIGKWCCGQGRGSGPIGKCKTCWDRPVPEELLEQRRKEGKRCY